MFTAQSVLFKSDLISPQMVRFATAINRESILEVVGIVKKASVKSCTQNDVEIDILEIYNVHKSAARIPFNIEDGSRRCEN